MLLVFCATLLVCLLVFALHYEGLRGLSYVVDHLKFPPRPRMLVVLVGILLLHMTEIMLFGSAYWALNTFTAVDGFVTDSPLGWNDYMFFSAIIYSSLGMDNIMPRGPTDFMVSVQAVVGLLMLGWSTSFIYLTMVRFWQLHEGR